MAAGIFSALGATAFSSIAFIVSVLTLALHVGCCIGIGKDAFALERENRGPLFLVAFQWALAGLVFGLAGLAVYWAIHHSTLSSLPRLSRDDGPNSTSR